MKYGKIGWVLFALVFVSAGIAAAMGAESAGYGVMSVVGQVCLLGSIVCWVLWMRATKEQRAEKKAARKEEQAQRKIERAERQREALLKQAEERRIKEKDNRPVAAVLVSTQDRYGKSVTGTAARTLLGGALFGTFGAAVGLATAQTKQTGQRAVFSVKYASGRIGTETVEVGSARFKELAKLLVD